MSLLTATGFKIGKRSNMRLNKKSAGTFDIQNNNGFIKRPGLKNKVSPLSKKQEELISNKIRSYTTAANRRLVMTMAITLMVSTGLIILARQVITLL
ncbi:MAG: hypothetical protein Roseis2KO_32380 [Roseivirga sp.]